RPLTLSTSPTLRPGWPRAVSSASCAGSRSTCVCSRPISWWRTSACSPPETRPREPPTPTAARRPSGEDLAWPISSPSTGGRVKRLFAVIRSRGPAWNDSLPLDDQVEWTAHAAFMNQLAREQFVALGGPLEGTPNVLLIVRATDEAE